MLLCLPLATCSHCLAMHPSSGLRPSPPSRGQALSPTRGEGFKRLSPCGRGRRVVFTRRVRGNVGYEKITSSLRGMFFALSNPEKTKNKKSWIAALQKTQLAMTIQSFVIVLSFKGWVYFSPLFNHLNNTPTTNNNIPHHNAGFK